MSGDSTTLPPVRVLLVEDSPTDAELAGEVLSDCPFEVTLETVQTAEEAFDSLGSGAGTPDLILLDLGLPGRSGTSLLADIRADAATRALPVIVLTTSEAQQDIVTTHELEADGYISKPLILDEFVFTVMRLRARTA